MMLMASLLAFAVAAVISSSLTWIIKSKLRLIKDLLFKTEEDDPSARVHMEGEDEFSDICLSIYSLVSTLNQTITTIKMMAI